MEPQTITETATERSFETESAAKAARRQDIQDGYDVSLIAPNPENSYRYTYNRVTT